MRRHTYRFILFLLFVLSGNTGCKEFDSRNGSMFDVPLKVAKREAKGTWKVVSAYYGMTNTSITYTQTYWEIKDEVLIITNEDGTTESMKIYWRQKGDTSKTNVISTDPSCETICSSDLVIYGYRDGYLILTQSFLDGPEYQLQRE